MGAATVIGALVDRWLRRAWRPDPERLAALPPGRPAVVVTGASEGIGRELARAFAQEDAALVLIARRREPLEAVAAELGRTHAAGVHALPLDLTQPGAADELQRFLGGHGLYVDILVNNAAIGLGGAFADHDEADLLALVDLDVRALTLLMQRVLPDMCVRGRGGILNVASLGGYAAGPYQAAYYAAKAYVIMLTRAVAHEVRGQGVRVSVLAPGPVETRFHERMGAETALYRLLLPSMSAPAVARSARRGYLIGHRVILPGLFAAPLALAMRLLPDVVIVPLLGLLLRPRGARADRN